MEIRGRAWRKRGESHESHEPFKHCSLIQSSKFCQIKRGGKEEKPQHFSIAPHALAARMKSGGERGERHEQVKPRQKTLFHESTE